MRQRPIHTSRCQGQDKVEAKCVAISHRVWVIKNTLQIGNVVLKICDAKITRVWLENAYSWLLRDSFFSGRRTGDATGIHLA